MAKEAIERYNQHIEQCNRAIEDAGSGQSPSGSATENDELKAKLQQTVGRPPGHDPGKRRAEGGTGAEDPRRDRPQLAGAGADGPDEREWQGAAVGAADSLSPASNAEYMKLINSLQQQLYAEREKNKHLKGA